MKIAAIAAITYAPTASDNVGFWDLAQFQNGMHLTGIEVPIFLAQFDLVVLQHWPPPEMVRKLRILCPRTRFLAHLAVEAIQANPCWAGGAQEQWRFRLLSKLLRGTDGTPIDVYAGTGSKKSAFCVDMMRTFSREELEILRDYMMSVQLDGWFVDSYTRYSYFGSAPNAPAERQDRIDAYPTFIRQLRSQTSAKAIWGNMVQAPITEEMSCVLDVIFCEQYFTGPQVWRQNLCISPQRSYGWMTATTDWNRLVAVAKEHSVENFWLCAAKTGEYVVPYILGMMR